MKEGFLQQTSHEEQLIYDHLLDCVKHQSPEEVIDGFRHLFIKGKDYYDHQIRVALARLVNSKTGEQNFNYILNRCCHILVNRWQMQPQLQGAIPALAELFEHLAPATGSYSTTSARLRELVIEFAKTDHCLKLKRLARVISEGKDTTYVGNLINRYPYLYEHYLLSEDSNFEDQKTVKQIQSRLQERFEIDLSKYVTYKVRQVKTSPETQLIVPSKTIIQPVGNPTLLSDRELGVALKQFVGTVEAGYTYRDLSHSFLTHSRQASNYKTFKDDLYQYLITSVDTKYGRHKFNETLYKKIQTILPHCDTKKPDEFIVLRTTSQLLNFLVVESNQRPNHYIFMDLITNMGATSTVGLLLKIVLLCHKVKPHLEKRFSILFTHYESFTKEGVPWLIKALENLNIAFSVNFGKADLSFLRQMM
ncbi:hypothetical protein [Gloeocapsa sp. PCC 73106]|uniref:hypothetical protein n=1 Tax=Gloeocapsa sp. PCC 73106 TaxID=102232 RepID=UPI0002ABD19E|nr:hypothetical protein [Gloeocapsa sp. PCC 73106]ELR96927.1 hypothetical protein GLO73106DRAFT_00007280 [Gloeocapsa sp. PCC 73106]